MRSLSFTALSIGAMLATGAFAQPVPSPAPLAPSVGPAPDEAAAPPPPGPRAERRPPPPPMPGIVVDRGPSGAFHLDLRCPPQDAIRECASIVMQMIDKLNGSVQAK